LDPKRTLSELCLDPKRNGGAAVLMAFDLIKLMSHSILF
jgi:hypothetical protein